MESKKANNPKKANDVKKVANYLLTFYNSEKQDTPIDIETEILDIAIGMNNLRLQKILYFAYGFYYSETKKELFEANFKASKFGPIIEEILKINNKATKKDDYKNIPVKTYQKYTYDDLNINLKVLNQILEKIKKFSTLTLVEISHEPGSPWSRTKQSDIINKDLVKSYFRNLELD